MKDGVSVGLALAMMARRHMRDTEAQCTHADGNGYYVLSVYKDKEKDLTFYALGTSPAGYEEAEKQALVVLKYRQPKLDLTKGVTVIDRSTFGLSDDQTVKIHCNYDKAVTIKAMHFIKGGVLIGRYQANGKSININHGKVQSGADRIPMPKNHNPLNEMSAPLPKLDPAVLGESIEVLVDAACGDLLTAPLKRSLIRSFSDWAYRSARKKQDEIDAACKAKNNGVPCAKPPQGDPGGKRG